MSKYQVYRLGRGTILLDLQNDVHESDTRVVAPLVPRNEGAPPIPVLHPVFQIDGETRKLRVEKLAAVRAHLLRDPILDLRDDHDAIQRSLDMLFLGH